MAFEALDRALSNHEGNRPYWVLAGLALISVILLGAPALAALAGLHLAPIITAKAAANLFLISLMAYGLYGFVRHFEKGGWWDSIGG